MAKRTSDSSPQRPNSHLRILFVELNGADTTIEEALRTVERMRRPGDYPPAQTKRIAPQSQSVDDVPHEPAAPLFNTQDNGQEEAPDNADIIQDREVASGARRKRGEGTKVDRNLGVDVIPNLDFMPSGKPALKSYFAEKAPTTDVNRVLVVAHYLQHTMEIPQFSAGHILTAFRHVGVSVPVDLPATIRNMKKKVLLNYTDMNTISMATEGINRVEHTLPKGK